MTSPQWHALWTGEGYNPRVMKLANVASGAYAIREKDTHEVLYVGESSRGTIWKTLLRHVQAPESFRKVRETGVLPKHPSSYEVALHITSRGHRPRESSKRKRELARRGVKHRTDADQRAMFAQSRWIERLKPTKNKDDGNSQAAADEYRAHLAKQEAEDAARPWYENPLRAQRANPLAPPASSEVEEFVFWASRLPDGLFIRPIDGRTFDIVGDGQTLVHGLRTKDLAEWLLESMKTARMDARLHSKVSELVGPPPFPPSTWGYSTMLSGEGSVYRTTEDEDIENVCATDRASRARFVAQLAGLGYGFAADVAKERDARRLRSQLGVTHALHVGDPVVWRTMSQEHQGKIQELLRENRLRISPWFSRRVGGKQWKLEQQPTDVPASMVMKKEPAPAPAKKARAPRVPRARAAAAARAPREVLKTIEAGKAHSIAVAKLAKSERAVADELVAKGLARRLPKRGRWPDRYVVTALGSHELGTFASTDESFRADAREAGALERERRAKASRSSSAKPAGYGSAVEKGKKAGQLKLFNPAPEGALVLLGKLTRLEPMKGPILRWSLRQAPWLVYDDAGRLFIVYDLRRIVRSSTPAEMREYGRTHWGQHAKGNVRDGGVAVGPFVRLGAAKSITYTTKKGTDSELVDYVHPFGEGASLRGFIAPQIVEHECIGGCGPRCAARGALALHGGSYRVTSRGIVG